MARLFVAIPLSPLLKQRLQNIQPPRTTGITPVAADNLHLTLQFIGNAPVEPALKALAQVDLPAFSLDFTQLGRFQKGVIWLGVKDSPELKSLQLAIFKALNKAGIKLQPKRFMPHITLARYKRHVPGEMIELLLKEKAGAIPTEEVIAFGLYTSETVDEVVTYKRLRAFPLAEGGQAPS